MAKARMMRDGFLEDRQGKTFFDVVSDPMVCRSGRCERTAKKYKSATPRRSQNGKRTGHQTTATYRLMLDQKANAFRVEEAAA